MTKRRSLRKIGVRIATWVRKEMNMAHQTQAELSRIRVERLNQAALLRSVCF